MAQPDVLPGLLQAKQESFRIALDDGFRIIGDTAELFKALAAAQGEFEAVKKTKTNPFFSSKYADLADVLDATLPALNKHGYCLIQPPSRPSAEGGSIVHTILGHSSGGRFEMTATIPAAEWQKFGSALTYCRRYQVSALLGVASEPDDDGNAADEKQDAPRQAQGPRQNTRPTPPAPPAKPKADAPKDSGGPSKAATPPTANGTAGKAESPPPPEGEGTWVQPSPPATEGKPASVPPPAPKPASVPPPSSGALITAEQQKEIGRLTTGGERLWPIQEPDGTFKCYKFTRATLDQFCQQVVQKTTVQISTADDAAKLLSGLNKLPESTPLQRKIWADIKARFGSDKERADAFSQETIGKPASWVCTPEEAEKLAAALQ